MSLVAAYEGPNRDAVDRLTNWRLVRRPAADHCGIHRSARRGAYGLPALVGRHGLLVGLGHDRPRLQFAHQALADLFGNVVALGDVGLAKIIVRVGVANADARPRFKELLSAVAAFLLDLGKTRDGLFLRGARGAGKQQGECKPLHGVVPSAPATGLYHIREGL